MKNEEVLMPAYQQLHQNMLNGEFVLDKSGVKMVEILSPRFELDPTQKLLQFNGRNTPIDYIQAEMEWYDSQDLDVSSIAKKAKIWASCADNNGKINSNYGHLVYSKENGNQYKNTLDELIKQPSSRRAIMLYNRPSMHTDYCKNGMKDFICTLAHQFFIRNNELHSIVEMRSNDGIFGLFCDFYFFATIQERILDDLKSIYPHLKQGKLIYIPNSFHIYEWKFDVLKKMVTTTFE